MVFQLLLAVCGKFQGMVELPLAWAGLSWVYQAPHGLVPIAQPVWAPALSATGKGADSLHSPCWTNGPRDIWGLWGAGEMEQVRKETV